MKNFNSAYPSWIFTCLLALFPTGISWAQAPLSPAADAILSGYAKEMGTIAFLEKIKMGLSFCGTTYQDLAGKAKREKTAFEMRNKDYVDLAEAGRATFYLQIAEAEGTSPRHVADFWDEKTAKSQEKTLNEWKQGVLKDWTSCLAFIERVQRGQSDIKEVYPEIYQSVITRKALTNQKQ